MASVELPTFSGCINPVASDLELEQCPHCLGRGRVRKPVRLLPEPDATGVYLFPDGSAVCPSRGEPGRWCAFMPNNVSVFKYSIHGLAWHDSADAAALALVERGFGPTSLRENRHTAGRDVEAMPVHSGVPDEDWREEADTRR